MSLELTQLEIRPLDGLDFTYGGGNTSFVVSNLMQHYIASTNVGNKEKDNQQSIGWECVKLLSGPR